MKCLFLISAFICLFFSNTSLACSRFEFGVPISAQFTRADAVFVGKVVKVEFLNGNDDYPKHSKRVHFKVEQNFKGAESSTLNLVIYDWKAMCGLNIKAGQTWIIYAKYDEKDKTFVSNTGNKYNSEEYKEDLEILKTASEGKIDTSISGRLTSFPEYNEYKFEAVEITVEGNGIQKTTNTNADGTFNITSLPAGNYKVKMKLPYKAEITTNLSNVDFNNTEGKTTFLEYEVELKQGDCDYSFFGIFKYSK